MKWLLVFMLIFLPFSSAFLPAQEADIQVNDTETAEQVDDVSGITEDSSLSVTSENDEINIDTAVLLPDSTADEPEYKLALYQRAAIAVGIIIVQIFLIWLIWHLFKKLEIKLGHSGKHKIKPLVIKKFTVFTVKQVVKVFEFFLRILKYVITAVLLFFTLPIVFSLFSATKELASKLISYVIDPLKDIASGALAYIPNLIKIIIFILITYYVLKGLRYFADKIEKGKLVIPRFYTEWAAPTYKILQVFLWAFTVALIYPFLPGSDSRAFQGVSVFIGIIFSIGSTSAIGNLVAGLVITYMRPFKTGDRVQIKEITGFVVEKNLMVVRLKTHKNEYVTFPNIMILNSNIINYNTSSDEDEEGLIIFAEVTIGYSTPWQTIHDILIKAALNTENVLKRPKPFVLQTKLDDFYACYQINCYTKDVSRVPQIYTMLYENIQNGFREAGLDMTSAHYREITINKK